jgi:DNA repair protein RadA/Sms
MKDVFLNIAGGIRVDDPASDLAVVAAILSSTVDIPVGKDICFAGELGLSGEIRPVNRIGQRIAEARKLGFKRIMLSTYSKKEIEPGKFDIEIDLVSKVQQIPKLLFG